MDCGIAPEFSPDGKLVLFRCASMWLHVPSGLYWVHPDGTGLPYTVENTIIEPCCSVVPGRTHLGASFSPSFSGGEGWITTLWFPSGWAPADVARIRIEDGGVVRTVNLTKSVWNESAPDWSTH